MGSKPQSIIKLMFVSREPDFRFHVFFYKNLICIRQIVFFRQGFQLIVGFRARTFHRFPRRSHSSFTSNSLQFRENDWSLRIAPPAFFFFFFVFFFFFFFFFFLGGGFWVFCVFFFFFFVSLYPSDCSSEQQPILGSAKASCVRIELIFLIVSSDLLYSIFSPPMF